VIEKRRIFTAGTTAFLENRTCKPPKIKKQFGMSGSVIQPGAVIRKFEEDSHRFSKPLQENDIINDDDSDGETWRSTQKIRKQQGQKAQRTQLSSSALAQNNMHIREIHNRTAKMKKSYEEDGMYKSFSLNFCHWMENLFNLLVTYFLICIYFST
jgi:hypothetical protein